MGGYHGAANSRGLILWVRPWFVRPDMLDPLTQWEKEGIFLASTLIARKTKGVGTCEHKRERERKVQLSPRKNKPLAEAT